MVLAYESELVWELLQPGGHETILDAGCGTGIFAAPFLTCGAIITGLDVSLPMLVRARRKLGNAPFTAVAGDMLHLPFADAVFDKAVSVTALEFIGEAKAAVAELFRVVKPGGRIVVATLNSLSPWAARRKAAAAEDRGSVFREARFYSPEEMRALAAVPASSGQPSIPQGRRPENHGGSAKIRAGAKGGNGRLHRRPVGQTRCRELTNPGGAEAAQYGAEHAPSSAPCLLLTDDNPFLMSMAGGEVR